MVPLAPGVRVTVRGAGAKLTAIVTAASTGARVREVTDPFDTPFTVTSTRWKPGWGAKPRVGVLPGSASSVSCGVTVPPPAGETAVVTINASTAVPVKGTSTPGRRGSLLAKVKTALRAPSECGGVKATSRS